MEDVRSILEASPLFSGLSPDQLASVARIAAERRFARGQVIFTEGDAADGFYVVARGKVKIFKVSPDGKEQILHIFGPGEPFGEVPVFTGKPFPASADALSETRLLFFPRQAFTGLVSANPALALGMLAVLSMRLRQFTVQIENLSLREVPGRLAAYLVYLSGKEAPRREIVLDISKGHLASLLGTIPETLSRIFSKMTAEGLIEVSGRVIRLKDRVGLEMLAEGGKSAADR